MTRSSVKQEISRNASILDSYPEFAPLSDPEHIRSLVVECLGREAGNVGKAQITRCRFSPESGIIVSFEIPLVSSHTGEKSVNRFYLNGVSAAGYAIGE